MESTLDSLQIFQADSLAPESHDGFRDALSDRRGACAEHPRITTILRHGPGDDAARHYWDEYRRAAVACPE